MSPPFVMSSRAVPLAWIAWAIFLLAALAVIVGQPDRRPANEAYAHGAQRWLSGTFLYGTNGGDFIYLPQSALLYAPFALLDKPAQNALWRIGTIGLFALGIYRFSRLA